VRQRWRACAEINHLQASFFGVQKLLTAAQWGVTTPAGYKLVRSGYQGSIQLHAEYSWRKGFCDWAAFVYATTNSGIEGRR